jgi:hypothetical protein
MQYGSRFFLCLFISSMSIALDVFSRLQVYMISGQKAWQGYREPPTLLGLYYF